MTKDKRTHNKTSSKQTSLEQDKIQNIYLG